MIILKIKPNQVLITEAACDKVQFYKNITRIEPARK